MAVVLLLPHVEARAASETTHSSAFSARCSCCRRSTVPRLQTYDEPILFLKNNSVFAWLSDWYASERTIESLFQQNSTFKFKIQLQVNHRFKNPRTLELHVGQIFSLQSVWRGTRWRSRFRHCAISRKVAGSIPNGIFH
jgi:hypothetical protein